MNPANRGIFACNGTRGMYLVQRETSKRHDRRREGQVKDIVSIIIPVYNAERYLAECLDSILNQSYSSLEVICVNDGSIDSSAAILDAYSKRDSRITVYSQENQGAPAARNNGILHMHGAYCVFFDADDTLRPNAIETLVASVKSQDADIVVGSYAERDDDSEVLRPASEGSAHSRKRIVYSAENRFLCVGFNPLPGNKLYRADFIRETGLRFLSVRIGQDLNFYLKAVALANRIVKIDAVIFNYRIVSGSISRQYTSKILDIIPSMRDVRQLYISQRFTKEYEKYVSVIELIAYRSQMKKIPRIADPAVRQQVYQELENSSRQVVYRPSCYCLQWAKERIKICRCLKRARLCTGRD